MKIRLPGTVIEISLYDKWTTIKFRDDDGEVCASFRGPVVRNGETITVPLQMEAYPCIEDHTTSMPDEEG